MTNSAKKLDIFEVLRRIDAKDRNYLNTLSAEARKAFVPFLVMQWMACINSKKHDVNDLQTILVNEFVNKYAFTLYKHPDLMYKLMTCCSTGQRQFYKWKKPPKKTIDFPLSVALLKEEYAMSTKEVVGVLHLVPSDEILMLAHERGYQKEQLKALQKELKNKQ